jgi:hypothetical protein
LKRSALAVIAALLLGTGLLTGCDSAKPNAGTGGGNPGKANPGNGTGAAQAATVPDPCSLITAGEAATALGPAGGGSLTKDTHQDEAQGIITHVCDYTGTDGGTVEISVAPGSYDQHEINTIQIAYHNSQPLSIGDGGIIFSIGNSSTAVEFWAHGLKVQVSSTTFSSKAPDTSTSAKTLANAALGRLP